MKRTEARAAAAEIIDMFRDAKVFDRWWDEFSRAEQQAVVNDIVEIIQTNESRDQN